MSSNVIFISGGATGIGRVMARRFLRAGSTVHVADVDPHAVEQFIAEHPGTSGSVCDVGDVAQVNRAFDELQALHGRLDVLVNNAGGGSIICIASTAALFGFPLRSPYAACKWAIIGFMKTLAMELGPERIRVNAICPGSVSGPRIDGVIERDAASRGMQPQEIRDLYLRQTSMRTFVEAEDVAEMAFFLASTAGARISGQAIGVDGHTEGLSNWLD